MPNEVDLLLIPHRHEPGGPFRASEGSAIELADGRLLYVYSHFTRGGHDHEVSNICGLVSKDSTGTQWSEPFLVQKNDARITTMIASLVRLGTAGRSALKVLQQGSGTKDFLEGTKGGALGLVYRKIEGAFRGGTYFRLSRDEGDSWSKEVRINSDWHGYKSMGPSNDTPLVLRNGRILVPVCGCAGLFGSSFCYYSDDEGNTWTRGTGETEVHVKVHGKTYATSHFGEPAAVELKDGRILMLGRTLTGRLCVSHSEDFGDTWTPAEPTDLACSASPSRIARIPSTGDLLLIWNQVTAEETAQGWGRLRMSCAISKDEGETWEHFKNLESLDDMTRVEPPPVGEGQDLMSGMVAIATRRQELGERQPPDKQRYPRADVGHWHVDYPSLTFTADSRAVITYGVYGGPSSIALEQTGCKLRILPAQWFYE